MLVTKIQLAAMSRSDIPNIEDRRPFYLYVDEFQNFATDSFAVILSEARKYALNLTIANQYISQMDEPVRNAVFGNVGTMITFRVSPDDSPFLVKYYEPQFEAGDLSDFHNRNFVTSMSINGEKAVPFSGTTLNIPPVTKDCVGQIVEQSREKYSSDKFSVEQTIIKNSLGQGANNPMVNPYATTNTQANPQSQTIPNANIRTPRIPLGAIISAPIEKLTESQKRRKRRKKAQEAAKLAEEQQLSATHSQQQQAQAPQQKTSTNQALHPKKNPRHATRPEIAPKTQPNHQQHAPKQPTEPPQDDPTVLRLR